MIKVAWIIVLALFVISATGIVPSSTGMLFTIIAIFLAMFLLAIDERRKLAANIKYGEKTMPKLQKNILAILVVLVFALIFIGGLTKQ